MHWGELSAEKKWKMADNLWKEIQLEIKGAIPFGLTNWQKLKKVFYSLLERVWRKDTIFILGWNLNWHIFESNVVIYVKILKCHQFSF